MTDEIKKLLCLRCTYIWYPRSPTLPKFCPKCNSPYWNKKRRKDVASQPNA